MQQQRSNEKKSEVWKAAATILYAIGNKKLNHVTLIPQSVSANYMFSYDRHTSKHTCCYQRSAWAKSSPQDTDCQEVETLDSPTTQDLATFLASQSEGAQIYQWTVDQPRKTEVKQL